MTIPTITPATRKSFAGLVIANIGGAFNDQAFKFWLIAVGPGLYLASQGLSSETIPEELSTRISAFGNALFLIPYVLFAPFAGLIADRFSKRSINLNLKLAELAIMALGFVAILTGNLIVGFSVLFLLALQSCLLTPAQLGLLPEMFDEKRIAWANGIMQMTYSATALVSATVGTALLANTTICPPWIAGLVFAVIALIGIAAALLVTYQPAAAPQISVVTNPYKPLWETLLLILKKPRLRYGMLGHIYFWVTAQIVFIYMITFARQFANPETGWHESTTIGILLTCLTLGIGSGSVLAGYLGGGRIELGFVPLGALGIALTGLDLGLADRSLLLTSLNFIVMGIAGGFFIVPLAAQLQDASPPDRRGRVLATESFFRNIIMLVAALLCLLLLTSANPRHVFLVIGLFSLAVTGYIVVLIPEWLLRLVVWVITRTIYRIRVQGKEHIPLFGPALIVPNHVTWIDGPLLVAAINRNIRFIAHQSFFEKPLLGWLLKIIQAIPVATESSPWANLRSLRKARDFLDQGELVVLFAEGQLTRTGNLARFKAGIEFIVKNTDHPVIPAYLDRAWGSIFSYYKGKFFWKRPEQFPFQVDVWLGEPLPSSVSTADIRDAVCSLGAEAYARRAEDSAHLGRQLIGSMKHAWSQLCIADTTGKSLTGGQTLVGALLLCKRVRRLCHDRQRIGIFLPPTVGGALANYGAALAGKSSVNLNYTMSKKMLDEMVQRAEVNTILTSRVFIEKIGFAPDGQLVYLEDLLPSITKSEKLFTGVCARVLPKSWLLRLMTGSASVAPDDEVTLMFTSGSTSTPKGVMLSHRNILSNVMSFLDVLSITPTDGMVGILPFFHVFGYTTCLWGPVMAKARAVYHTNPLDYAAIGTMIREHQLTVLMATPTFLMLYIRKCQPEDFASLRLAISGAEKLRASIAESFLKRFNLPVREGYGSTELSPVVSVNIPDVEIFDGFTHIGTKPGTIGQPLPSVHVRIVNPDTHAPMPINQDGVIIVRGPGVMKGYLNDPQATEEVIQNGWFITGDIGHMDEDGFITITDRLSRFAKIGGEKVPLVHAEEAIHEAVGSEERVCVVCAVPDELKGERLVALYLKDSFDPKQITQTMRAQGAPNLFIPRPDDFFPVTEFPLLGSGKLNLKQAKQLALEFATKKT